MNKVETVHIGAVTAAPDTSSSTVLTAIALMAAAGALAIAGIYLLFGIGWALLASAPVPGALGWLLLRGVTRGR